jgi:hypothetical protein
MHDPKDLRRQAAAWRQAADRHVAAEIAAALTLAAVSLEQQAAALEADGAAAAAPQWAPWLTRRLTSDLA